MSQEAIDDDKYLWLEVLDSEEALNWVTCHNAPTLARLSGERFDQLRSDALEVFDADTRIPWVTRRGEFLYNFWRDASHSRGIWRRTTLEEYCKDRPDWDVIVDVDALADAEDENWVWGGCGINAPGYTRAIIFLSRGGGDATVVREFDMSTRQFVTDGFNLPEAKHTIEFEDDDCVLVGTDFGDGSMTASGYPRLIKRWRRNTPLAEAETIFSGEPGDVSVSVTCSDEPGFERTHFYRRIDFYNRQILALRNDELIPLDIPSDAKIAVHRQWAMILLMSDWTTGDTTHEAGSVLITEYDDLLGGTAKPHPVFIPGGEDFFAGGSFSGEVFLSIKLRDVATTVEVLTPGTWQSEPLPGVPDNATIGLVGTDQFGDEIFLSASSFHTPTRLLHGRSAGPVREIKSAPALFDAENLVVTQQFAESVDGTRIPYFLVRHRDSKGPSPTLLYGYGGFRQPQLPGYLGLVGRLWLARGGSYALANIRGGGEYGPSWHSQAVRANRHKVTEDFAAVAQDLVSTGITSPSRLGAMGGSAGGLLIGVMLTQYPELFGALICSNPLLDMRRFHLLLAGASWIAEFGDPDDLADWHFIKKYSPYHNIDNASDRSYPAVLITTTTGDDRVHPGHARKMAAALEAAGHDVHFYETNEGGHSGAPDNIQASLQTAIVWEFLLQKILD